jgi:hypothetical protein
MSRRRRSSCCFFPSASRRAHSDRPIVCRSISHCWRSRYIVRADFGITGLHNGVVSVSIASTSRGVTPPGWRFSRGVALWNPYERRVTSGRGSAARLLRTALSQSVSCSHAGESAFLARDHLLPRRAAHVPLPGRIACSGRQRGRTAAWTFCGFWSSFSTG